MIELVPLIGGTPEGGPGAGGISFLFPILFILVIYWFLLLRPQQKQAQRHQKLLASLKKGDEVVTDSGLVGTILSIHDDFVVLKAGENVKLKFVKSRIAQRTSELAPAGGGKGK